jgi:hypothetical protein
MKRSPMQPGKGFKSRATPMNRGAATLSRSGSLKPSGKRLAARSKRNSDPRPKTGEAELCRGQPCYLRIAGVCMGGTETTVPCHSNQARHGKGRGIKAHDLYTVPGCWRCHAEIDQGALLTREDKFALWDDAYERWAKDRDQLQHQKG